MKRERIGELFVKAGLISHEALALALEENRRQPQEKLGHTLVRLNLTSDAELARALSLQSNIPYIDLNMVVIDPHAVKQVRADLSMKHRMLPIYIEKNNLILAVEDPYDFEAVEAARFASGLNVRPHVAAFSDIVAGLKRYYSVDDTAGPAKQDVNPDEDIELLLQHVRPSEQQLQALKEQSESPAIIKMVNTIIFQGLAVRASAIRIDPRPKEVLVKNRVDGALVDSMKIPKRKQAALISRLKMMAGMDFTKRHIPQKGRTKFKMHQRMIEMEVSCLPSQHGESLNINILDTGESIPLIKDLGLLPDEVTKLHKLLWLRQGLVLVCGPAGHGKTRTLYTLANELSGQQRKIITLDDAIEYQLKEAHQVQINEAAGLTYTQALQSVLRHKSDVIVVGEIRSKDAAEMAMNASQREHLVLSILRTDTIMDTIGRVKELGVDPHLFASSLSGILTQRLVRKMCTHCREKYVPAPKLLKKVELLLGEKLSYAFYHGKGCQACNYTGYQDRCGVYHVLIMNPGLQRLIMQNTPKSGTETGISRIETKLLMKNILEKVKQGVTTLEELERVLFPAGEAEKPKIATCKQCRQPVEPGNELCPACQRARQTPAAAPPGATTPGTVSPGTGPAPQQARKAVKKEVPDTRYTFKGCKILLVDPDTSMIQRLRGALLEKQFTVATATNGEEALEKIAREKPHLVITEVVIPKVDGLNLIRRLRKDTATASIPVIIVSAKGTTTDRLKGFAVGTDDYVPKPFSMHELFFRINAILRRTYK